jgi:Family of unknown function (DUF6516)
MKADLWYRSKTVLSDGSIVEMVIWKLPIAVIGSPHLYKYRLFYGNDRNRIVGYDNERGKGDHKHVDGVEVPYQFTSVERLMEDFLTDVRNSRMK